MQLRAPKPEQSLSDLQLVGSPQLPVAPDELPLPEDELAPDELPLPATTEVVIESGLPTAMLAPASACATASSPVATGEIG